MLHWKNGCLPSEERDQVLNAAKSLPDSFSNQITGFYDDTGFYYSMNLTVTPQEFREKLEVLAELLGYHLTPNTPVQDIEKRAETSVFKKTILTDGDTM